MITKESWKRLADSISSKAGALAGKSLNCYSHYSIEESVKSGNVSTVIGMIVELESELRVLKRRLIQALPEDERAVYNLSQAALVTAAAETQELNSPIK